jgi:hypothetical protein
MFLAYGKSGPDIVHVTLRNVPASSKTEKKVTNFRNKPRGFVAKTVLVSKLLKCKKKELKWIKIRSRDRSCTVVSCVYVLYKASHNSEWCDCNFIKESEENINIGN